MGSSYIVQRMQQESQTKPISSSLLQAKTEEWVPREVVVFKLRSVHAPSNMKFLFLSSCRLPLGTSHEVLKPVCTSSQ